MLHHAVLALVAAQAVSAQHIVARQTDCSDLSVVVARGTTEPNATTNGQFGAIVGDPLVAAVKNLIPGTVGYNVPYPASFACDSSSIGIADVLSYLQSESAACPAQKFALVGYSQGADVINHAASQLPSSLYDAVIAIVQFGDPNNRGKGQLDPLGGDTAGPLPSELQNKVKENCAVDDPVCTNNGTIYTQHLTYSNAGTTFINDSALYIQKQLLSNGQSGFDGSDDAAPGDQTNENVSALLQLASLLGEDPSSIVNTCSATTTSGGSATTGVSVRSVGSSIATVTANSTATAYATVTANSTVSAYAAGTPSLTAPAYGGYTANPVTGSNVTSAGNTTAYGGYTANPVTGSNVTSVGSTTAYAAPSKYSTAAAGNGSATTSANSSIANPAYGSSTPTASAVPYTGGSVTVGSSIQLTIVLGSIVVVVLAMFTL